MGKDRRLQGIHGKLMVKYDGKWKRGKLTGIYLHVEPPRG
jgi:hypothetical protein